ncbi:hypothetical protein F4859DRAFT_520257 [Xylaria cf. heliscus]|nr:hypothetical protein F4859DRAFT_520257 [Xylaria cf. heliscus]
MAKKLKYTAPGLQQPDPPQSQLRRMMPSAGMIYKSNYQLMHSANREKRIANALEGIGHHLSPECIAHAFTDMFRAAVPLVRAVRAQGLSLWDALPWVQHRLNWARDLPAATFFELFTCLIQARHEWLMGNTPTPCRGEEGLTREIDVFRVSVGDCSEDVVEGGGAGGEYASWILIDAVFYNDLASGLYEGEDEDEDEDEGVESQDAEDEDKDKDDGEEFITDALGVVPEVVPPIKQTEKKDEA